MNLKRIVLIILLIVCLVSAIGAAILFLQIPHPGGKYQVLLMASGSMEPTINLGNHILVDTSVNVSEIVTGPYPVGDVIVFHLSSGSDELIVHRAINETTINGTIYFITQGDANNIPGPPNAQPGLPAGAVPFSEVVGKVVNCNFTNSIPLGFWLLLGTAVASGVACLTVFSLVRRDKVPAALSSTVSALEPKQTFEPSGTKSYRYCESENKNDAVHCEKCGKNIT